MSIRNQPTSVGPQPTSVGPQPTSVGPQPESFGLTPTRAQFVVADVVRDPVLPSSQVADLWRICYGDLVPRLGPSDARLVHDMCRGIDGPSYLGRQHPSSVPRGCP